MNLENNKSMTYDELLQMENNIVVFSNWSIETLIDNSECLWHITPYLNQELLLESLLSELKNPFGSYTQRLNLYKTCVLQCLATLN